MVYQNLNLDILWIVDWYIRNASSQITFAWFILYSDYRFWFLIFIDIHLWIWNQIESASTLNPIFTSQRISSWSTWHFLQNMINLIFINNTWPTWPFIQNMISLIFIHNMNYTHPYWIRSWYLRLKDYFVHLNNRIINHWLQFNDHVIHRYWSHVKNGSLTVNLYQYPNNIIIFVICTNIIS